MVDSISRQSLWKAVYNAKDMGSGELPTTMFGEGNEINDEYLPEKLADLFKFIFFLCLILINSPTGFARRGINFMTK